MARKEKAKELVDGFFALQDTIEWGDEALNDEMGELYEINGEHYNVYWKELAKKSALLAVYQIINATIIYYSDDKQYWEEVKAEIEKL